MLAAVCAASAACYCAPADAASTPVAVMAAAHATLSGWDAKVIPDPAATTGQAVMVGSNGSVTLQVQLPSPADTTTLRMRGDQCSGSPAYSLTVDGVQVASGTVTSASWTSVSYSRFLGAGTHTVSVAFTNYSFNIYPACSRRLYVDNFSFSASSSLIAPGNPPIPAGFVHQSGTQLLDGADQPLKLRGVDLGGWLSWEGWIWGESMDYVGESTMMNNLTSLVGQAQANQFQTGVYDNYITGSDFKAISQDGFNVARVPFSYRLLEADSNPFVYKQSGWDVLDQLVSEAAANNVYLILDMQVAPCSQTISFTADYVGWPDLWASQSCQSRMVAMWRAIAARYANDNVVAGYDLLNEPDASNQQLLSLYQQATAAIRQVDPNHLLIYQGNDLARTFTLFTKPLDSNEMLEFHDYSWMVPNQSLAQRMPAYNAAAVAMDAPIWAGEFGQDVYSGIANYVTTFNQDPLISGWADWTWKQSPGLAALQTLQLSPDAQMLINWMDNPSRPKPTLAQAGQGMSDFITEVQYANTLPNAEMQQVMATGSL